MIPHFSVGRRSECPAPVPSPAILSASSPRSISVTAPCARSRSSRRRPSVCGTIGCRSGGTGCGRSSVPSCRATRSPSSWRAPTSWGDVDHVVPADDREVHLALRRVVLHLLRIPEDEVHVRGEPVEDSPVSPPAFQLNHHVRIDALIEQRKRLNHGPTGGPWS